MPNETKKIPKEKQTALALYVTAKEAYAKWQATPDKVKIIDVRTPEEYLFVGHPTMAWKIPVAVQVYEWDAEKKQFPMKVLPDFVARVPTVAKLTKPSWPCAAPVAAVPWRAICSPRPGSSTCTTCGTSQAISPLPNSPTRVTVLTGAQRQKGESEGAT